ncbi:aldehyde dehydrogenase family protein [Nocardia sp. CA-119907]|uniref:aldehyde dehydrogenase family protein n=1 Tax=Nocardia sp. CA-119907 TaxID=3239973 RepID=UPI003D974405
MRAPAESASGESVKAAREYVTMSNSVRTYGHIIGGQERRSAEVIERSNPATDQHVASFAAGTAEDVDAAVGAARQAFDDGRWSRRSGADRSRLLLALAGAIGDHREQLAAIDAEEVGKPLNLAREDVDGAIAHFEYAAALAHEVHGDQYTNLGEAYLGLIAREPVGVVGLIAPWNFPALSYAEKAAYALAAGCTTVIKPSEYTSGSSVEITRLAATVGIPHGVLNVVTGLGDVVGRGIVEHPGVDFVSFTGSTATGKRIAAMAAVQLKRVALELGGKGANIVCVDADLGAAVDGALRAAFFNTGECCVAGSRLLVEHSIADAFLAEVVERTAKLVVGFSEDADIGALIHETHAQKVIGHIDQARAEGGTILTGGTRLRPDGLTGTFVAPTVIDSVTPTMRIYQEEVFGPVLCAVRFTGTDEAIKLANDTNYGLGNSVWTNNLDSMMRFKRELRSGTVWINTTIDSAPQMTFGGTKDSGYGREVGRAGLEEFTELKSCVIRAGAA